MDSLENVRKLLRFRNRHDLAYLLKRSLISFDESDSYGSYLYSRLTTAEIYSPIEEYDQLSKLKDEDRQAILDVLLEIYPPRPHDIEIHHIEFRLDTSTLSEDFNETDEVVKDIEAQRNLMIAVSTGGPKINTVNNEYKQRRERIQSELNNLEISDPNPYSDLWEWYGKWSSGDMPSYQSRRTYITDLYRPLIHRLKTGSKSKGVEVFSEPTGWAKVDRGITEVRRRLEEANTEEQFQAVGLLCREVLISLSQLVYDPNQHNSSDGTTPSQTDAKRMLEAYLSSELSSKTNEISRRHAKASLDLANDLQHRRTANFRQGALCAEATTSVVNIIAIISGQRDPN